MQMRGYSLMEMSMSLVFFAAIAGSAATSLLQDNHAQRALTAQVGPAMRLRSAIHRIGVDLRMAGIWGEDSNHDGYLQSREDLNGNGILDADWSLPDGETHNDLAFNSRADLRDDDGAVIATGVYSPMIRYLLVDGRVIRERTLYDDEGNATTVRATLADSIRSISFSRKGGVIKVHGEVDVVLGGGKIETTSLETRIWLRN